MIYTFGNIAIAGALILLILVTRRNIPKVNIVTKKCSPPLYSQIYTKFSTVADILASIGIGAMFMCMISVLVIALSLWFEKEEKDIEETEANPADLVVYIILETYLTYILKNLITIQWMIYTGVNSRLLYKWVSISNRFKLR